MYHANCQIAQCDDCDRQSRRVAAKRHRGYEDIKYAFMPDVYDEPVGHMHYVVGPRCLICDARIL